MNAVRKRVVALAHAVLNETTGNYTPTDHWTDDDWYMFQYASTTDEQRTEIARFLMDSEKIKQYGQGAIRVASSTHNPFSVEDGARRIISDSNTKTGVFEPVWLAVLRHIIERKESTLADNASCKDTRYGDGGCCGGVASLKREC